MRELQYDFQTWYSNFKLMSYATELQKILDGLSTGTHTLSCYSFSKSVEAYTPKQGYVCFEDLIRYSPLFLSPLKPLFGILCSLTIANVKRQQ